MTLQELVTRTSTLTMLLASLSILAGCPPSQPEKRPSVVQASATQSIAGRYQLEYRDQNLNSVPVGRKEVLELRDDGTYVRTEAAFQGTDTELQTGSYEYKDGLVTLAPRTYKGFARADAEEHFTKEGKDRQTAGELTEVGFERIVVALEGTKLVDQRTPMAGPDGIAKQRVWTRL